MIANAAREAARAASTRVVNSSNESTPEPLSAVPAMAAITESILSASTPVMPNAARSCGVNAGTTTSPAAVANIDFTIAARAIISARVSTAVVDNLSITSFRSDALAAVLISVMPSAPYWDAVATMPLSSMPFAPYNAAT